MTQSTANVVVRIRPLVCHELDNGSNTCVSVVPGKQKIQVGDSQKSYRFDRVFGPEADNENFYDSAVLNAVVEVFAERNVTIAAYGQRSSGKTHTMGTNYTGAIDAGIIPRAIKTLFKVVSSNTDSRYQVTVTFVEIYNKELYDLLAPNKVGKERIVEVGKKAAFHLTELKVTNAEDALKCLIRGSRERATSEKTGNPQSTRSHAVFTISVKKRKDVDPRITTTTRLNLVDLAGSCRGRKAERRGNINKDLVAVGNLMNHIRKGKFASYTKYRDSKLAIFLCDSLRENSTTLFVACVSPADCCLNETLSTLRYGNRLRKRKNSIFESSSEVRDEPDEEEMDDSVTVESHSCKFVEVSSPAVPEVDAEAERTHDIPDASKSSEDEIHKSIRMEIDEEMTAGKLEDDLELSEANETKEAFVQSKTEEEAVEKRFPDAMESDKSNESNQESSGTDNEVEERVDDASKSDESDESEQESNDTSRDSLSELDRTRDSSGTGSSSGTEQNSIQSEMEETEAEKIPDSETSAESLDEKAIEDSASKFFLKLADYFLEPSPSERNELQNEIRSLQKMLRDRTEKLNKNLTDALSRHERAGLSEKRRDSAKSVVAMILEEFQEVLMKIVENSGKRDLIVRAYRRVHEQAKEQQEVARKMMERETLADAAMDEKYARHTMRQVERYQELQGVNRCIALLIELIISLPVQSAPVGELVERLEETSNKIKALEMEKINLVQDLKSDESSDERRRSSDYEVEKVLALDESISILWRRRIKHMICIERREELDQQIDNMKAQIESLRKSRGRLVEEMRDAEKLWKRTVSTASVEGEKRIVETGEKKTATSFVRLKCMCKVTGCSNRLCRCVKNGVACVNCDCNSKLCRNSNRNAINAADEISVPPVAAESKATLKCGCKANCSTRNCLCRKKATFCGDDCKCNADICKNNRKENESSDESSTESPVSAISTDGKMKIDAATKLPAELCACRKNGTPCTNCNRSLKLPDYKTKRKARRRLFADTELPNESEGNEQPSKRTRLET